MVPLFLQKMHLSFCFIFISTNVILVHVILCILLYCKLCRYVDFAQLSLWLQMCLSSLYHLYNYFSPIFFVLLSFSLFPLWIKDVSISFVNGDRINSRHFGNGPTLVICFSLDIVKSHCLGMLRFSCP